MTKKLYILGLPIGNLSDVSERLRESLISNKTFFVEDTRNFFKLLNLLGISSEGKYIQAFHEHNQSRVTQIVEKYLHSENICIVSDAGSPILSDPGFPLVREWVENGGAVESISGPSAVLVALEISGLPPLPFKFHGFLPKKKESLTSLFNSCEGGVTHVFFESPHRIRSSVDQLCSLKKDASICVARELTKKFEEHYRFSSNEWINQEVVMKEKGEFVLLFHDKSETGHSSEVNKNYSALVDQYMKKPSKKSLARLFAEIKGTTVADTYSQL